MVKSIKKTLLTYSKLRTEITGNYNPPETPIEKQLILLWQNVLRIERIGINDNFFTLGGDSILAMQLIAKANTNFGLSFTVKDLIQSPTIGGLASRVSRHEALAQLNPENLTGDVPLSPIQHWFFSQAFKNPVQWSQICLIKLSNLVKIDYLIPAIHYVLKQHDSLYLRYQQQKTGWRQYYMTEADASIVFFSVVLDTNSEPDILIDATGQWLQAQFDLNKGPLAGIAILVEETTKAPVKILFAMHHLLVDGVSWRILLSEIENLYPYFARQQTPPPIPSTVSFSHWSNKLQQLAKLDFFAAEYPQWKQLEQLYKPLPQDFTGPNIESASANLKLSLGVDTTQALSGKIHAVYRTQINDVLLAALLRTLVDWSQHNTLVFDLETHGRCDDLLELNSINTVGWFTNLFPVALTLHERQWQKLLPDVRQQLKKHTNQGLGYGVLRYLSSTPLVRRPAAPHAQIAFNYWGKFSDHFEEDQLFSWESVKLLSGPDNERTHLINFDCVIQSGQFVISLTYSQNHYTQTTMTHLINGFGDALLEIVQHCLTTDAATYHPADFPLVNLSEQQLQHLVRIHTDSRIENIYPLTPTQQGLIFEQWLHPDGPHYQVQARWKMRGQLDQFALKRAFEQLFRRHEILRSHISWQESAESLQIIQQEVVIPWRVHDLRPLRYDEQNQLLSELIALDRKNILSIETAPLAQLHIVLMADDHFEMICHFHHAILTAGVFLFTAGVTPLLSGRMQK